MQQYIFYHLPWKVLMLAIFIQSSISSIDMPDLGFSFQDKLLHFIVFGILAFLLVRSLKITKIKYFRNNYLYYAIFITGIYGIIDEIHQYFVPGRSSTFGDWLADVIGAIFFVAVFHFIEKRKFNMKNKSA